MADRLTDLVLGLQRMAENARIRGDDLRYLQQQETYEHVAWLDQLLGMVGKVNAVLMEERKKFLPVERERVHQLPQDENIPRVVKQGPLPAHLRPKTEAATG
jgi:hypothetical protein